MSHEHVQGGPEVTLIFDKKFTERSIFDRAAISGMAGSLHRLLRDEAVIEIIVSLDAHGGISVTGR